MLRTTRLTCASPYLTCTVTRAPGACLRTLVRASRTIRYAVRPTTGEARAGSPSSVSSAGVPTLTDSATSPARAGRRRRLVAVRVRAQDPDQVPQFVQGLAAGDPQVLGRPPGRLIGGGHPQRPGLQHHQADAVGHHVMHLAGQPGPFLGPGLLPASRYYCGLRPGVHGLVGVHVLDVALGHLPQRLRAVGAGPLADGPGHGDLPVGPGPGGEAALLDDAEQPPGGVGIDAPAGQALPGQRQQAAQHQFGHGHLTQAGPVQPGVHAVPRGLVQVLGRGRERHLGPDRPLRLGQGPDQPVVERGVGHDVRDGRAGRQDPVLDAQVGLAVDDGVDGTVPAVDGPVVQAHLGQLRGGPGVQHGQRVLLLAERQQGREVPDVLLEQVEHGRDPAFAEPHPGPHTLLFQLVRPGVGGLLEQGDAGLGPQLPAEQERGVGGQGDLDARDGLGRVPVARERLRADLDVQLHAGARGLGRDAARVGEQGLGAVDRDAQVLPARREDLLVQDPVALVGRHGVLVHVVFGQRGQDADHDQPAPRAAGLGVRGIEAGADLLLQVRERAALQPPGRHVDLEVELPELGRPGGVGDRVEDGRVAHGRRPGQSTRFSSISTPTRDGLASNRRSRSIRAKTSSERCSFSRYLRRSSPLIVMALMSRPMGPPLAEMGEHLPPEAVSSHRARHRHTVARPVRRRHRSCGPSRSSRSRRWRRRRRPRPRATTG